MEAPYSQVIADTFLQAAGIPAPWRALRFQIDEIAKIVHIWITSAPPQEVQKKRSWFGLATTVVVTPQPMAGPDQHWRHTNCMEFACQIHTVDALNPRHHDLPWLGRPGLPFTNRLARQVFLCLNEGMDIGVICTLFNIPFSDLWKFKYALDNGQVAFETSSVTRHRHAVPSAPEPTSTSVPANIAIQRSTSVPDVADPVWEHLITGQRNIEIKTLSFQLILTKLRQQVSLQQNDEVKLMKLRELHRYVERNERSLAHELQQLNQPTSETA